MSSPFYQQFSAKSPLLQAKKSQLERANALVKESQSDVDAARATFGTKDVDESFDRKLNVLKKRVKKANSLGSNIDYDTTDASDAGEKRSSETSSTLIPQGGKKAATIVGSQVPKASSTLVPQAGTPSTSSDIKYPDPRE